MATEDDKKQQLLFLNRLNWNVFLRLLITSVRPVCGSNSKSWTNIYHHNVFSKSFSSSFLWYFTTFITFTIFNFWILYHYLAEHGDNNQKDDYQTWFELLVCYKKRHDFDMKWLKLEKIIVENTIEVIPEASSWDRDSRALIRSIIRSQLRPKGEKYVGFLWLN